VILVSDFILPSAESAAGPYVEVLLEVGQDVGDACVTSERGCWVSIVEMSIVGRYNFIGFL